MRCWIVWAFECFNPIVRPWVEPCELAKWLVDFNLFTLCYCLFQGFLGLKIDYCVHNVLEGVLGSLFPLYIEYIPYAYQCQLIIIVIEHRECG